MSMLSLAFICISYGNFVHGRFTDLVQTDKGPVRGEIVNTIQDSSIKYSAFRAIPYAEPPIGQLRFQSPVEAAAWKNTLIATSEAPSCPQLSSNGTYYGSEDCLFLNVYTPKTSFKTCDDELLAVMVWIYGGSFVSGEINSNRFGPDFLIADDVVIVDMNYRLGALGATGNMGLKDQLLALKWVQKNIEKFGGDPKKVTIFGQSAGASSALLHQISPASRGLFKRVIAMSGSPLNPWGFASRAQAVQQSYDIGKKLGISNSNKKKFLEDFRRKSAAQIVIATSKVPAEQEELPTFMPTDEDRTKARDAFLTACPTKSYIAGNYTPVPVMLGYTNKETLSYATSLASLLGTVKYDREYAKSLGEENFPLSSEDYAVLNEVGKNVNNVDSRAIYSAVNVTTDLEYVLGIDSTQRYLTSSARPIYYYRNSFDYAESLHRFHGINLTGTGHEDDLLQIFWQTEAPQPLDPESPIGIQRTKMVRLWTNFAKYGNPTPDGTADPILNVYWIPSGVTGAILEIGQNELKLGPRPTDEFVKRIQSSTKFENACGFSFNSTFS